MQDVREIEKIIEYFNIEEVIINELVSYFQILDVLDFLVELKKIHNNINFIFMGHDFFCVCPMYNLLNYEIKYCDVPSDLNYCDKCIKLNPIVQQNYPNLTIALWREKFGNLLKYSSKIICFSQSSKEIVKKAYRNLSECKFEIKPHIVDWVRPVVISKTSETINVAALGHLTVHKGAHIVASLASYIDYYNINIKMHIFGDILEPYESFGFMKTVIKHGRYKKTDLPKLMEENEIDIVFIPSIWPETFSYTTEEAIKMDLPVAVFDIGAPAERVKSYNKGVILEKQDPEYIISAIYKYFNKNIVLNNKKKDIVFVCVSNSDLIYSRAILSSTYMTEYKILKYDNAEENISIPIRYNDAIDKLLASNYSGWIFFVHNDFSIMEPIDNIADKLEHTNLYGPIGAILKGSEKIIYGQILQWHNEGLFTTVLK
jgi:glycosyltransferase involved in cell wall biosynthesis